MRYCFTSNQIAKIREIMMSFVEKIRTLHEKNKNW